MIEQGLLARQSASIKKSTAESCYSFVNNKSSFKIKINTNNNTLKLIVEIYHSLKLILIITVAITQYHNK